MSYIIMSCAMVDTLKYTGEKAWRQFEMAAVLLVVAIPQRLSDPCHARLSTLPSTGGRGLWGRASTLCLLWGFPPIQLSFGAEPKIPSSSGSPLKVARVHLLAWFYWKGALFVLGESTLQCETRPATWAWGLLQRGTCNQTQNVV